MKYPVILIRPDQLCAIDAAQRELFVQRMCAHLRRHFGPELADVDDPALHDRVSETIDRAATYDLRSERDCCRFLNIAARYGWRFEDAPQHAWMKRILTDAGVSSPSDRLRMLVDECVYRGAVAAKNRALADAFGLVVEEPE